MEISYDIFHYFVGEVAGGSTSRLNGAITNSTVSTPYAMPRTLGSSVVPVADVIHSSSAAFTSIAPSEDNL